LTPEAGKETFDLRRTGEWVRVSSVDDASSDQRPYARRTKVPTPNKRSTVKITSTHITVDERWERSDCLGSMVMIILKEGMRKNEGERGEGDDEGR